MWENIKKKIDLWKKFPQQLALFENFHKNNFFEKNYTKLCSIGKLSQKIALLEYFHINIFVGKFPEEYALFDNFHKKRNVGKLP